MGNAIKIVLFLSLYIYILHKHVYIYIKILIYNIYIYIVIKEKTNNIFKVKIFRLLPLSIHNVYVCILFTMVVYK